MSFCKGTDGFLSAIVKEKKQFGIDATRWLMDTGIQEAEHHPVENQNVQILEKQAAGVFAMAGEEALYQAKADIELWKLILSKEVEFSKNPACLDRGANLIYVVRKL